jgi:polysaccharide export outer membrane protein
VSHPPAALRHLAGTDRTHRPTPRRGRTLVGVAGLALVLTAAGGCEVDSYLDPSVIGRWEKTPASVPILERLTAIEDDPGQLVEYSDVSPEDLLPEAWEYRVGAGDVLEVRIFDLVERNVPSDFQRTVDSRGEINIPQLGSIQVAGRTIEQVRETIVAAAAPLVPDALVEVDAVSRRQQLFHIIGSVEAPGPYFIPSPDYRLIEAITNSGRFPETTTEEIYVIRQVTLADDPTRPAPLPAGQDSFPRPGTPEPARDLTDIIDQLTEPGATPARPSGTPPAGAPQPGVFSSRQDGARPQGGAPAPAIDLVETARRPQGANAAPAAPANEPPPRWVFINGRWMRATDAPRLPAAPTAGAPGLPAAPARPGADPSQPAPPIDLPGLPGAPSAPAAPTFPAGGVPTSTDDVRTQRVIRIPTRELFAGVAKYNIVVRPGDTIRVPPPVDGVFYMDGQVNRVGPYGLPINGRMTLTRAVTAAGGLGGLAIPERVDLTRVVGKDRQATIRLDLRAIAEGTQPDVYLKPDDRVNIGTNFWALPLAVVRGGFRMSYGFGFLLDRNFADDVFGPLDNVNNR